jgi:hypothetical protein
MKGIQEPPGKTAGAADEVNGSAGFMLNTQSIDLEQFTVCGP